MEIKILKDEKNELLFEVDNLTLVELLRNYLNQDKAVSFAAWKREHPTKKPVLNIKTDGKTAKKALHDALSAIEKDTSKLAADFKKAK